MCSIISCIFRTLYMIVTCQIIQCAIETMKGLLVCINTFFGAAGILVTVIGGMLVSNTEMIDTYGDGVVTIGTGFIILGVFTILTAMCGMCGVKSFNKKYLFGYCIVLGMILAIEVGFASYAINNANAGNVYNICVQKNNTATPIDPSTGLAVDCANFQKNDLRLGSYLLWQTLWNDAQLYDSDMIKYKTKKTQYVFLQHLQESGRCCGFGKPIEIGDLSMCKPNNEKWSVGGNAIQYQNCYGYDADSFKDPGTADAPTFKGEDNYKGLYCEYTPVAGKVFAESDCLMAGKSVPFPLSTRKQMQYDFPMGNCVSRCHAYGCAEAIFSYVEKRIAALSLVVLIVVLINVIALMLAVCILCAHQTGLSDDNPHQRGIQNSGDRVAKSGGKDTELV